MIIHIGLPFATLLSVVLMIKPMATLLDHGIEQMGMPTSFGAILIALLVLSPEGVAAYNAAARNQLQRAVNLSLGSFYTWHDQQPGRESGVCSVNTLRPC